VLKGQINLQGGGKKQKQSIYILRKNFQILKEEGK